jgi:hypothetical protein
METPRDRHTLGGVFSIVSGTVGILGALALILIVVLLGFVINTETGQEDLSQSDSYITTVFLLFYGFIGLVYIGLGVLGIIGGVFALQKKHWGMALTGAIAGAVTLFPCGIAAIIFVTLAKPEFSVPKPPEVPVSQPAA